MFLLHTVVLRLLRECYLVEEGVGDLLAPGEQLAVAEGDAELAVRVEDSGHRGLVGGAAVALGG